MFSASPNAFSVGRRSQAHERNSLLGCAVMTSSGFSWAVACDGGLPQSLMDRLWLSFSLGSLGGHGWSAGGPSTELHHPCRQPSFNGTHQVHTQLLAGKRIWGEPRGEAIYHNSIMNLHFLEFGLWRPAWKTIPFCSQLLLADRPTIKLNQIAPDYWWGDRSCFWV